MPKLCKQPQLCGTKIAPLVQENFSFAKVYERAQRGLPTPYPYCDFYSILSGLPTTEADRKVFFRDLLQLYFFANENQTEAKNALLMAFSPNFWNQFSKNKVQEPVFDYKYNTYYKSNLQLLFIHKKNTKTGNKNVSQAIVTFITKYSLNCENYQVLTRGMSQANDDIKDTVIGGKFNDNIETPKDPYSLALHGLIGYENSSHLGGAYVLAQKIDLKWDQLSNHESKYQGIVGRMKIQGNKNDDSTIFSQNWCPHSHIKNSRVKDDNGNPVEMVRQSKPYFTQDPVPGILSRQKGVYFIGYLNDPDKILKIVNTQFNNDHLIKYFNTLLGNILYVPSVVELGCQAYIEPASQSSILKSLSIYHGINWDSAFPGVGIASPSPYLFYSRAQYLQKMSTAQGEQITTLEPPTSRTLRILSKTFALWQDTWYFDRRQPQMGSLGDYIGNIDESFLDFLKQEKNQKLGDLCKKIKAYVTEKSKSKTLDQESLIKKRQLLINTLGSVPIQIRQALAVYVQLGYVLTSEEYGHRGANSQGKFGAATYHIQPQDVLAGGQANLTFGQGKHLLDYMTEEQRQNGWYNGSTITEHSGVGHVVPHLDQIMKYGIQFIIDKFSTHKNIAKDDKTYKLFLGAVIALKGMQQYFKRYADLCDKKAASLSESQIYSKNNLISLAADLRHIASDKPVTFRQAAQLALSTFICLHITGQPVSIGRLDQALLASGTIPANLSQITPEHQQIIDSFWIKVGQKVNLNTSFFEDHQKWGNLAMGGASSPYPQGGSFNQWGHQVTVGGTTRDGKLAYNSVTMMCLKAARRLPLNAPCLGLRVRKDMPLQFLRQATKAILSGGAHPILLNDDIVINRIVESGNYSINAANTWKKVKTLDQNKKQIEVGLEKYNPQVSIEDARDYSSDGCYEFLLSGKCWFCLSGLPALAPLQLLLNQGKELVSAGSRFIHGKRTHFELYPLSELEKGTFNEFLQKYFTIFKKTIKKNFTFQLGAFGGISSVWTTSLLNAFTDGIVERGLDFYSNGTKYNQFCPQFTGIANLVNSLWNIKKYVFEEQQLTLQQVRMMLLTNWGNQMAQPFVPSKLPNYLEGQFQSKCQFWRRLISLSEQKFGIHPNVSSFGIDISKRISQITVQVFSKPNQQTLQMLKTLTGKYTNSQVTFGLQIMPGCGTFENYQDNGFDLGASFDGRLKSQSVAQDYSLQPYYADFNPYNKRYKFRQVLQNYQDPNFSSGSVLDFNIDQDFDEQQLFECLQLFTQGYGPNVITVTVCNREHIEELQFNKQKDLLRFRMGGWTQFGVAMFPDLLNHHIRRIRTVA